MKLSTDITSITADPVTFGKKRKNPIAYTMNFKGKSLAVMGHYEADCGGCDTLPTYQFIMDLIKEYHDKQYHVLFEGLLVSHDTKQCKLLWEWLGNKNFVIIELTNSLEICLNSVKERRIRKGKDPEFNQKNTIRHFSEVIKSCEKLETIGIPIVRCLREDVVNTIERLLDD